MEAYNKVAKAKASKSVLQLFIGGIFAGMFIAFGGICSQMISAEGLPKALSALTFSVGLIMVIYTGTELFTGNCLLFSSVFDGAIKWTDLTRNWICVYLGNLVGSLLFAGSVCYVGMPKMFNGKLQEIMMSAYSAKLDQTASVLFIKGIFCNILVCLAVWCAIHIPEAAGKAIAAAVPVFVFVYCGFEHSVANMFFLPVAVFSGGVDHMIPWVMIARQIIIVTAGNIIGGLIVSVGLNYPFKK